MLKAAATLLIVPCMCVRDERQKPVENVSAQLFLKTQGPWPRKEDKIWSCKPGNVSAFCNYLQDAFLYFDQCENQSQWTNIRWRLVLNSQTTQDLAKDVRDRLENPVSHIDQAAQNLCGTAAYVFMMAVAMPEQYNALVRNLWCLGEYTPFNINIKAIHDWQPVVAKHVYKDRELLNNWKDLQRMKIPSVDWMVMISLRNSQSDVQKDPNVEFPSKKECQGCGCQNYEEYMKMLFNTENTQIFDHSFKTNQLPDGEWNEVMNFAGMPYIFLPLGIFVGTHKEVEDFTKAYLRETSNHAVVLVTVTSSDCIIWTWAQLYKLPCAGLRQVTVTARQLDFEDLTVTGRLQNHIVHLDRIKDLKEKAIENIDRLTKWGNFVGEEFK